MEEINLAPLNVRGAGGGEGLGRCFLPDCPFSIVYQLSTEQFV